MNIDAINAIGRFVRSEFLEINEILEIVTQALQDFSVDGGSRT